MLLHYTPQRGNEKVWVDQLQREALHEHSDAMEMFLKIPFFTLNFWERRKYKTNFEEIHLQILIFVKTEDCRQVFVGPGASIKGMCYRGIQLSSGGTDTLEQTD